MKGVLLQTTSPTEVGAHWSESRLNDELLTPVSGAESERVSAMTMAFMEDTKWYKADYRVVENYSYMKHKPAHCSMKTTCNPQKSCKKGTSGFVTYDYRGIAYCDLDTEDNCYKEVRYGNRDVSKPSGWGADIKNYGASFGAQSVIVKGNFLRFVDNFSSIQNVSVTVAEAICDSSHSHYTMTFKNYAVDPSGPGYKGDVKVICDKANATKKFNCYEGYCSEVVCYDPKIFCPRRGEEIGDVAKDAKKCDVSCMKNGRCQPGLPFLSHKPAKRRLAFLGRTEHKEILRHFPSERRMAAANRNQQKMRIRNRLQAMDTQQLQQRVNAFTKRCKSMSKDDSCGPKKGFCQVGWCHKKLRKCGNSARYFKNKFANYSRKPVCSSLSYAKALLKKRIESENFMKGYDIDFSGHRSFQNMKMSLDNLTDPISDSEVKVQKQLKALQPKTKKPKKPVTVAKAPKNKKASKSTPKKAVKKIAVAAPKTAKKTTNVKAKYLKPDARVVDDDWGTLKARDIQKIATESKTGSWKCWCYQSAKAEATCPDLVEDQKSA
jgi:hypothetical protein